MAELPPHDKLIASATRLFYENGFHATGIEKILASAGVSKMTLYRHFGSKDELILAVMRRFDQRFRDWLASRVEREGDTPRARLLRIFDALADILQGGAFAELDFLGCPFVKAASEYSQLSHPIHRVAAEHKRQVREYFKQLARDAGARDPDQLATALFLEFEGAYVTAQVTGDLGTAKEARAVAEALIASSLDQ